MSLNISDALNATTQHALARSPVNSTHIVKRSSGDPQDNSDAVPRPKSLPQETVDPVMRPHAPVSTEESLRRLPDSVEPGKFKSRARKASADNADSKTAQDASSSQRKRSPYDPVPAKHRNLDLLA